MATYSGLTQRIDALFMSNFHWVMLAFALAIALLLFELTLKPIQRFFHWLGEAADAPDPLSFRFCSLCGGNSVEPLRDLAPIGKASLPIFLGTTFGGIDDFGKAPIILPGEWLHGFCIECKGYVRSIFPEGTAAGLKLPFSTPMESHDDAPLITTEYVGIVMALVIFSLLGFCLGHLIHASQWGVAGGCIFGLVLGGLAIWRGSTADLSGEGTG